MPNINREEFKKIIEKLKTDFPRKDNVEIVIEKIQKKSKQKRTKEEKELLKDYEELTNEVFRVKNKIENMEEYVEQYN